MAVYRKILTLCVVLAVLPAVFCARQAFALGSCWNPQEDTPYTASFTDESNNVVTGEFMKKVEWEWKDRNKVKIIKWDYSATFSFKDKKGKVLKIPNSLVKRRILDLQPGFTGTLKGSIVGSVK